MAQSVTTTITDDLDGSSNAAPVRFSIDGKAYRVDLSSRNRAAFDKAMAKYVEAARRDAGAGARGARGPARGRGKVAGARTSGKTRYGRLSGEQKVAFRTWAVKEKLTTKTARRIADSAVKEWVDAGRP